MKRLQARRRRYPLSTRNAGRPVEEPSPSSTPSMYGIGRNAIAVAAACAGHGNCHQPFAHELPANVQTCRRQCQTDLFETVMEQADLLTECAEGARKPQPKGVSLSKFKGMIRYRQRQKSMPNTNAPCASRVQRAGAGGRKRDGVDTQGIDRGKEALAPG